MNVEIHKVVSGPAGGKQNIIIKDIHNRQIAGIQPITLDFGYLCTTKFIVDKINDSVKIFSTLADAIGYIYDLTSMNAIDAIFENICKEIDVKELYKEKHQ